MKSYFDLTGKFALVVGASSGLGAQFARALLYFASDASSYCTGQVLYVDGGLTSQV